MAGFRNLKAARALESKAEEDYRDTGNYRPVLPASSLKLYCCCLKCWKRIMFSLSLYFIHKLLWGKVVCKSFCCILTLKEEFNLLVVCVKYFHAGFRPNLARLKCLIIMCVVGFLLALKSFHLIYFFFYLQLQDCLWSHTEHTAFKHDHIFFEVAVSNGD